MRKPRKQISNNKWKYRGNWKPHQVSDPAMLSFVVIGLKLSTFAWLLLFWLFWLCQTQLVWLANISFLTHNIPKKFQVWWKIAAMTTLPSHHFSWLGLGRCFKFLRCFVSFCKWLGLLFGCVPTGGWLGGAEKFAPFAKFAPTSEIWFGPIATLQILPSIVNVVQLVSDPIVTPAMVTDFS